jgi:hypothetical protein
MPVDPRLMTRLKHLSSATLAAATLVSLAAAAPAAAANTTGPDYHANCTAGFAAGSANDGSPGAVGSVAQPPKQFGALSDVGYYSRTNCA